MILAVELSPQYHQLISLTFMIWQMFLSAIIDFAGHSGKLDAAFEIVQEARNQGMHVGKISYSSLMGACSNVCIIKEFFAWVGS